MNENQFALKQSAPIIPAYIFLGIAFGVMMQEAGFAVWWSTIAAVFIYAGSMQIVMVSLLAAGLPLGELAIMTFFINARHLFYGIGFIERFRKMGWRGVYMVLALTDEVYSVLCSMAVPKELDGQKVDFAVARICHAAWITGCTVGAVAGTLIPFDMTGIDFCATAFFVVVVVNQWIQFPSKIPAVAGFASGILFRILLGPDSFILPALSVSVVVLVIMRDVISRKEAVA